MKVAIIGMGVVGRAQARMFGPHTHVAYDLAQADYPERAISECDFAVIAVGTPPRDDGQADLEPLFCAMARLPETMPVLIRSTVPPGTTASIQAGRSGITAHAPEFMYEGATGPWLRATDVPFMLLGGVSAARSWFLPYLKRVFPGTIHSCPSTVAELAKYVANIHWAMRVTFVNEVAAVSEAFGVDWEDTRAAWLQDSRVHPDHTLMAGFAPGFGGRCWPKDLAALIAAASDAGYKAEFLEAIQAANERFRA